MKHASHLIVLLAAISVLLAGCVDPIPNPPDQAPIDPLDGVCGSLAGEFVTEQTFQSASGTQLCADSVAIDKGLSDSTFSWTCPGLRGGEATLCQASLEPENTVPDTNETDDSVLPQPGESVPQGAFRGWYYDNSDFTNLYDTRVDDVIAFDWNSGAPIEGMGVDTFSIEWQGRFTFREGYYDFYVHADDGMRIYVDDLLVFDEWREQDETFIQRVHFNETRVYTLRVLHYENEWSAAAGLEWEYVGLNQDGCQSDSDCSSGEVCEVATNAAVGECVASGSAVPDGSCEADSDCSSGEVCEVATNAAVGECVAPVANTETDADGYDGELLAWAPYETPGQVERIENYEPLDDQTFTGAIRVRVPDDVGLDSVTFYLNDDAMNTDTSAPFDMRSGTNNELTLAIGELTIDARLRFEDSSERNLTATFMIREPGCLDDTECESGYVCELTNTNGRGTCVEASGSEDPTCDPRIITSCGNGYVVSCGSDGQWECIPSDGGSGDADASGKASFDVVAEVRNTYIGGPNPYDSVPYRISVKDESGLVVEELDTYGQHEFSLAPGRYRWRVDVTKPSDLYLPEQGVVDVFAGETSPVDIEFDHPFPLDYVVEVKINTECAWLGMSCTDYKRKFYGTAIYDAPPSYHQYDHSDSLYDCSAGVEVRNIGGGEVRCEQTYTSGNCRSYGITACGPGSPPPPPDPAPAPPP